MQHLRKEGDVFCLCCGCRCGNWFLSGASFLYLQHDGRLSGGTAAVIKHNGVIKLKKKYYKPKITISEYVLNEYVATCSQRLMSDGSVCGTTDSYFENGKTYFTSSMQYCYVPFYWYDTICGLEHAELIDNKNDWSAAAGFFSS